jgi:transposase
MDGWWPHGGIEMNRPSYRSLATENRKLRRENDSLRKENAALKIRVAELEMALDAAERRAKRQAAPFSRGEPKAAPRTPGRKSGRRYGRKGHRLPPSPKCVDAHYEVPLPDSCPCCGGVHLEETHVASQYQTDIPCRPIVRQFDIHFGVCLDCGHLVHGRHELQTSDAVGAAASQLGPAAHAAIGVLNKEFGLSHGKIQRCLKTLFGISISRACSVHSVMRTATRCHRAYRDICSQIRASPCVVPDETGWRVGGRKAWLHAVVGKDATCYEVASDRGSAVIERLLGLDWSGVLIHDGWSPYDALTKARHQQCLAHLRRRCERILKTARGGAVRFPREVLKLIEAAFAIREAYERRQLDVDETAMQGLALACYLEQLTNGSFTNDQNRRLAKHLKKHIWNWFWFLLEPGIEATNWQAEQAIRPGVVNRKVWGGNRTWPGARTQSVLMSVLRTCAQRGQDGFKYLTRVLCSTSPVPLPTRER